MNTNRCLKIAERIDALLLHELGQGVDSLRMVAEPLYARDVLLVCDALPGTELPTLAQQFRVAATERAQPVAADARPASGKGRDRARNGSRKGPRKAAGAAAASGPRAESRAEKSAGHSSSFGASVWSRLASGFGFTVPGASSAPDSQTAAPTGSGTKPPARRWFSPSRWPFGR